MENRKQLHILLVEDHKQTARVVQHQLTRGGYQVTAVYTGEQALIEAKQKQFEFIILDIGLPDISGLEVLSRLRAESYTTPVLILSAQAEVDDRVKGLKFGADDYLSKPFDARELLARIETILNRSGDQRTGILQCEDLILDVVKRNVVRGNKKIILTPKEFTLLEYFLRHPSEVISRKRLAEEVWGLTFDPGTNVVDVNVSRLRKSINEGFDKKLISTIHGEGFILRPDF
jgi:DNA-binding response OmpR family regulator